MKRNEVMIPVAMLAFKPRGPVGAPALIPAGFWLDSLLAVSTKSCSEFLMISPRSGRSSPAKRRAPHAPERAGAQFLDAFLWAMR